MPTPSLLTCSACHGLSPAARPTCLHCDARLTTPRFGRVRALGRVLGAGGALVTLMACYGMVARPMDARYADCRGDADNDTVCANTDCDDTRPDIYPGAADPDQDGIDQNCDGVDGWRDPAEVAIDPPAPQSITSPAPPPDPAPPPSP
jgi:hypothetical protein